MPPDTLASVPAPKRNCPICKIQFYPASLAGQELWHCAECNGTAWPRPSMMKLRPEEAKQPLQTGDLERAHKTPPYFTPRQKPPFLICPLCSKRMKETKVATVPVDICEKCSCLWLDGPKLAKFDALLGPYKWKMTRE
ncbi:MAG: zf-TFIIB domain-containing protein [bacterium]